MYKATDSRQGIGKKSDPGEEDEACQPNPYLKGLVFTASLWLMGQQSYYHFKGVIIPDNT